MVEESNHTSRTKNKIIEVLKAINKQGAYGRLEKRANIVLVASAGT